VWEEVKHSFCLHTLITDLSPSDGEMAKVCLDSRCPYIGLCFTDVHVEKLYAHLIDYILENLGETQSPHFNHTFKAAMNATDADKGGDGSGNSGGAPGGGIGGGRGRSRGGGRGRGRGGGAEAGPAQNPL